MIMPERLCGFVQKGKSKDILRFTACLQDECAKEIQADFIVTRNTGDFRHSKVKATTPNEFLETLEKHGLRCKGTIM